jgi:hypothetical protein
MPTSQLRQSGGSATSWPATKKLLRNSLLGSRRMCPRPSPYFELPPSTGGGSARPTDLSGSTRKSNDAQVSHTLFLNEASLLRLASAFLSEISDDCETECAYLNMDAR